MKTTLLSVYLELKNPRGYI